MSAESPIAHRTRGAASYEDAALNGICKICSTRLLSMEDLWVHLRDEHTNDHVKRAKAMEAFPISFQLDRLADCLPIDTLRSTPTLHSPPAPCSPHGSPQVMESTRIDAQTDYCAIQIEASHTDPPPKDLPSQALDSTSEVLNGTMAPRNDTDLNVAMHMDSPPSLSQQPTEVLTVDGFVSPIPLDLNVTLSKSVSIQIDDEGEPMPPCTMVLHGDLHNLSMPRILEVPSPSGEGAHIRIEQTLPVTMTKPFAPTGKPKSKSHVDPPGTPRNSPSQSPPREQSSPSVLDIILQDDVVIDIEPELIELTKEWEGKITGSPNKAAFPPPSYARVAANGANGPATCAKETAANTNKTAANMNKTATNGNRTTGRAILRRCDICQKRCYTEKGLRSHQESCLKKMKSSDRREQDASIFNHDDVAASESKKDNVMKRERQVVRNTYCRHCDKKIFLTSTLEDHYRRKHSRSLSPQGKPLSKVKPEPLKKTGSNGPMAVQPSTSKRAQGLLKSIPHDSMDETAKIPPPARSTAANKVGTGGNPPLPNVLVPVATEDTLPSPDPVPAHTAKTERRNEKKFICDFCERRFATAGALDDHARCVHEAVPEMTFAFEDEGESADFTQRSAAKTLREQPTVNYSCDRCSASNPTSFLSKERLGKHMAQCHAEPIQGNNHTTEASEVASPPENREIKSTDPLPKRKIWKQRRRGTKVSPEEHIKEEEEVLLKALEDIPLIESEGEANRRHHGKEQPRGQTQSHNCHPCGLTFPTNFALLRHKKIAHGGRTGQKKKAQDTSKKQWCRHCAGYFDNVQGLSTHIKEKHNDIVQIDPSSEYRSRVIEINGQDVTDASIPHGDAIITIEDETVKPDHNTHICVYCELRCGTTEELLTHMEQLHKIDTPHPREVVKTLHNSIRKKIGDQPLPLVLDPNNNPNGTPPKACEQCGAKVRSKKGLRYHMLQMHGVPLRQGKGLRQEDRREDTKIIGKRPPLPAPQKV
ncbi:hypothetical protein TNCV_4952411 [Trichonephila clavipes]|nr:hypothetical protein TNCV_4952411 [Trichonephila clavipes]